MHSLSAVDLNLVVALHALLEERSVTRAAARIGLSQPAVSHALSRLRDQFGDPLLMRAGRRMVLTARAEALRPEVASTVLQLERLMRPPRFDPAGLETRVRLVTDDGIGFTLLPDIVRRLRAEAPGVELEVLPRGPPGRKALVRTGKVDLAIGHIGGAGIDLHRQPLYDDPWVCVLRAGHPALEAGFDAAGWASAGQVIVSPTGGQRGDVDAVLERAGMSRRVVLAVPHFLVALAVVARSDLVLTTVESLATTQEDPLGLVLRTPPLPMEALEICMLWDSRTHHDPVQHWLRSVVADASRAWSVGRREGRE